MRTEREGKEAEEKKVRQEENGCSQAGHMHSYRMPRCKGQVRLGFREYPMSIKLHDILKWKNMGYSILDLRLLLMLCKTEEPSDRKEMALYPFPSYVYLENLSVVSM